jgi:hypothetical protein
MKSSPGLGFKLVGVTLPAGHRTGTTRPGHAVPEPISSDFTLEFMARRRLVSSARRA